jgi:protein involved in polysaccharide export with SLBB domain
MPSRRSSAIFGIRFFSVAKNTFAPNMKLAAPKSYILGPDDQLQLILTGVNESSQLLKITPDGFINIKYVGKKNGAILSTIKSRTNQTYFITQ